MANLSDHLKYQYLPVAKFMGGVTDTIETFKDPTKKINDFVVSSFLSQIPGLEFICLYDNSSYSDRFKNRIFEFFVKCPTEQLNDPEKTQIVNLLIQNLQIVLQTTKAKGK